MNKKKVLEQAQKKAIDERELLISIRSFKIGYIAMSLWIMLFLLESGLNGTFDYRYVVMVTSVIFVMSLYRMLKMRNDRELLWLVMSSVCFIVSIISYVLIELI